MEPTWEFLREEGQRIFYKKFDDDEYSFGAKAYECLTTVEDKTSDWGFRRVPNSEVPASYLVKIPLYWRSGNDRFEGEIMEIAERAENLDEAAIRAIQRAKNYETSLENGGSDAVCELRLLREAVRAHMNETGHGRCWMDDKRLYERLPEGCQADFQLPPKAEWDKQCKLHCDAYWHNRQPDDTKERSDDGTNLRMVQEDIGDG